MPVEPGQTLSHYRLIEQIGAGGMGVVWKAEDTVLKRTVAIKVLPADVFRDDKRRRMFFANICTLAGCVRRCSTTKAIGTISLVTFGAAMGGAIHFVRERSGSAPIWGP